MPHPQKCRSCGDAIYWLVTARGKRMPVDALPSEGGNIRISRGIAEVVRADKHEGEILHKSHFATCVFAARHRKEKP